MGYAPFRPHPQSHGTTSDGVTVFSNAAIMDEGYDNLNAPNLLSINVLMV